MQLHYESIGHGQPLILLHGLFGSADNWGRIAKHFAETHQVISVDLRNHGRSPHHDSQDYTDMANDLVELCDTLNLAPIHLLGHSLGGKVAMQFAAQHPERLNQLIVVDMVMREYPDEHMHLIDAMMAVDLAMMRSRAEVDKTLSRSINNVMVRQFLLMNLIKTEHGLRWRINLPALKANYPTMIKAMPAQYHQPSLFIRGERSDYVRDDDIAQIQTHFSKAQFASLPTDHWVHTEQPQAFTELVTQFLTNSM